MTIRVWLNQNEDYLRLPEPLRRLLDAELAAGNDVVEIFHSFPAPPAGACFRLAQRLLTRLPEANDGLTYHQRNTSLHSEEITNEDRFFFIIGPPLPSEPERDMDASKPFATTRNQQPIAEQPVTAKTGSPFARFKSSMVMDYEKWHDGIGYDVSLIAQMNDAEKLELEQLLLTKSEIGPFDVEALAMIDTPNARERLVQAAMGSDFSVRNAVQRFVPELISTKARTESLVTALRECSLYSGLSEALDAAAEFHPPEVIHALLDGARCRDGETACLMAAMLLYIHGIADEPFDSTHRPFFLRFNTTDPTGRTQAFSELLERIVSLDQAMED